MRAQLPYRHLWKLAGEDPEILQNSKKSIQFRFALSGAILFMLFCLGLLSYHHTFSQIFKISNFSWILALLFSLMVFNIYKLNLITIGAKTNRRGAAYLISVCCRIIFMALLGLSIIKPLEALYLKKVLTAELVQLKIREIEKSQKKTSYYYDASIMEYRERIKNLKEQEEVGRISLEKTNFNRLKYMKEKLVDEKKAAMLETERLIQTSPYFVKGLLLLNKKFAWIWYISIAFLFLFLLPFFLKYFIFQSSTYIKDCAELENNIVLEEYESFKKRYRQIFQEIIGKEIAWQERFEDPPFNLILKTIIRKTGNERDFLKHLNGP